MAFISAGGRNRVVPPHDHERRAIDLRQQRREVGPLGQSAERGRIVVGIAGQDRPPHALDDFDLAVQSRGGQQVAEASPPAENRPLRAPAARRSRTGLRRPAACRPRPACRRESTPPAALGAIGTTGRRCNRPSKARRARSARRSSANSSVAASASAQSIDRHLVRRSGPRRRCSSRARSRDQSPGQRIRPDGPISNGPSESRGAGPRDGLCRVRSQEPNAGNRTFKCGRVA